MYGTYCYGVVVCGQIIELEKAHTWRVRPKITVNWTGKAKVATPWTAKAKISTAWTKKARIFNT
jgi:hypothetical protein